MVCRAGGKLYEVKFDQLSSLIGFYLWILHYYQWNESCISPDVH